MATGNGATHRFVQEWSAESPYCGAMVMRNGGGDTCGLHRDDPVHALPDRIQKAIQGLQRDVGKLP